MKGEEKMSETWHRVAEVSAGEPECPWPVSVARRKIILFILPSGVFATASRCTHAEASLAEGYVEDGKIYCPLHHGSFEIRTGRACDPPADEDLAVYPTRIEDGWIYVCL